MKFAEILTKLMDSRNLSAYRIFKDTDIPEATIGRWKNGKSVPNSENLQKLSAYFGVSTDYLLGKVDYPELYDLALQKVDDEAARTRLPSTEEIIKHIGIPVGGMVPVVGVIRAGLPILAEENIEGWEFTTLPNPKEYFYLRVTGDSMIGAGIQEGALVLIHQQPCADNGQIVACIVDGENATLKRFHQHGKTVMLIPENSNYDPIVLDASDFDPEYGRARILGVVKRVTFEP